MSLFIRLWIIGTVIALAAGAIATGTYVFVTEQQQTAHLRHEAASIGRLLGHAMSTEVSEPMVEDERVALLEERALQFMASGRLLSITVVNSDLQPVIMKTLPGLETEEAWNELGPEPFIQVFNQPANNLQRVDDAFYVLSPLIGENGSLQFILAFGLPRQAMQLSDDNQAIFISLTVPLSLILGLIAAWVLTRQVGRPISLLTTTADRLESGRFDTTVLTPLIARRDEIGRLARTMLRLVQALDHLGAEMDRGRGGSDIRTPKREKRL